MAAIVVRCLCTPAALALPCSLGTAPVPSAEPRPRWRTARAAYPPNSHAKSSGPCSALSFPPTGSRHRRRREQPAAKAAPPTARAVVGSGRPVTAQHASYVVRRPCVCHPNLRVGSGVEASFCL
eukprot:3718666-Prymnesium_polylepis.1